MMWKKVRKMCKKISSRMPEGLYRKLTLPTLLIIAVTFLIISIICIIYYKGAYQEREISNQRQQMDKVVYGISTIQGTVENVSKQIVASESIQHSIQNRGKITAESFKAADDIQNMLSTYTFIMDYIQEVLIYTNDGNTFSSSAFRYEFEPSAEQWYLDFKETGESKGYTNVHTTTVAQNGRRGEVISYVMTFYSMSDYNQELGDLVISLEYTPIEKMAALDMSLLEGYAVYNERGEQVIGKGKIGIAYDELLDIGENRFKDKDGNIYLISNELSNDWIIVTEVSGRLLNRQVLFVEVMIVLAFVVLAFLIAVVMSVNIKKVVGPINRLSMAAEQFGKGNFDVSVNVNTGDEVEILANAFNKMVLDVQRYTEMIVEHEKIIRTSQVDQLLLQINPHFIYNTLNSITYMARIEGNKNIEEFVNAFISLLQSTLRVENKVYTTLGEELRNVENYLILQKYRYADKFEEYMYCPEELKEYHVPKVILQPIVENAIFHGIAPLEGKGKLIISVEEKSGKLCIIVEDNGIGMSDDMIEKLFDEKYIAGNGMRKIGIANVYRRIKEICGEEYGFHIDSRRGVGTRVIIDLPLKIEQEDR